MICKRVVRFLAIIFIIFASAAQIVYNTCAYNTGRKVNVHMRSGEVAEDMANLLNRLEKCFQSIDRDFISHWHHSFAFCLCMGEFESNVGPICEYIWY